MTAAERLDARNDVILSIADIDEKLSGLFTGTTSYRAVAEARELLDIRLELAVDLIAMGGQPGPAPVQLSGGKAVAV